MVCQQNVRYTSPNRMNIFHNLFRGNTPGHLITKFILYKTEISVNSTICASD